MMQLAHTVRSRFGAEGGKRAAKQTVRAQLTGPTANWLYQILTYANPETNVEQSRQTEFRAIPRGLINILRLVSPQYPKSVNWEDFKSRQDSRFRSDVHENSPVARLSNRAAVRNTSKSTELRDLGNQVGGAVRVTVLVVVPRQDLDHALADDHRPRGVENAAVAIPNDVAGDDRVGVVF